MLEGRLKVRRAPRTAIQKPAILSNDASGAPIEIAIEDLSETGCLIYAPVALPVGAKVTVGIAGLGRRQAFVRRIEGRLAGCAFVRPIAAADVARARANQVVVPLSSSALHPGSSLLDPPAPSGLALVDEVADVATVMEGQLFAHPPAYFHPSLVLIAVAAFAIAILGALLR